MTTYGDLGMRRTLAFVLLMLLQCVGCSTSGHGGTKPAPNDPNSVPTPLPEEAGSITGWVWHDVCEGDWAPASPSEMSPPGCIADNSIGTASHGDGIPDPHEPGIVGVVIDLGLGSCPSTGLAATLTSAVDLSFRFDGLGLGTYCVSVDPAQGSNESVLMDGIWTYPFVSHGPTWATVTIGRGENRFGIEFGWDFDSKP